MVKEHKNTLELFPLYNCTKLATDIMTIQKERGNQNIFASST